MPNSKTNENTKDLATVLKPITHLESTIGKAVTAASAPSAIMKAMEKAMLHQSAFDKALANFNQTSALARLTSNLTAQQSIFDKAIAAANRATAFESSMLRTQTMLEKTIASLSKPLAFEKLATSLSNHQSILDKAISAAIARPKIIENSLKSITELNRSLESMVTSSGIARSLRTIESSSKFLMGDSKILASMMESVANIPIELEPELSASDIETLNQELDGSFDAKSFREKFLNLPPTLRAFFFFVLLQILLPQINNISSNLLTPIVKSHIEDDDLSKREKINKIKKAPQCLEFVCIEELRFISGTNVRLRQGPSTNSAILDEMDLGQIVTVLSQNKNWIRVTYGYEEGEVLEGWVFTRYAKKFKR